jgi:hypothetical protein
VELKETSTVTIAVGSDLAPRVEAGLREEGMALQQAGPARGAAEAAVLITVSVSSLTTLALLVEKLRRLRLPRTYIYPRAGAPDIRIDEEVRDGRILVVKPDGSVEELPDQEIGVAALRAALQSPPADA